MSPFRFSSRARAGGLAALALAGWCGLAAVTRLAAAPAREAVCAWTETPPRLDGKGDESAWKAAPPVELVVPGTLAKPETATRARLLWDRENLYFLADMEDRDLTAEVAEHDGRLWERDVFELFFKPSDEHPGYFEFEVNPREAVLDMFLPRRGDGGYDRYRAEGDFHVEVKAALKGTLNRPEDRDRGWTVEGRIPWSDFLRAGGRPEIGESWKMALCRNDYSQGKPALSSSAPLTRPSFHQYEDYGTLRFAGPDARAGRPFGIERRVPLTTSRVAGSPDPPDPYRSRRLYPKLKLTYPVTVVRQPNSDRMLAIVQQWPGGPSSLVRFRDDPDVDSFETLLKVDRCAYDLTFHPDFARNGYLYLGSKGPLSAAMPERQAGVIRYTLARDGSLDPASAKTIIEWPSDGHDGSALVFGKDGMLWVTSGDGTSDSDTHIVGQDLGRLTAKLLRIDVDHPDPGLAYGIPKDNPFLRQPGVRPETWAYGFRNPWRIALDRETGGIWVGMNGQDLWESAYLVKKGANYGWSVFEGSHPFYPDRKLGPTPVSKPTVEHHHSEARSLTGGQVYYGKRYPELRGAYIYGDYSTGKIWGVKMDPSDPAGEKILWHRELADTTLQITGFGTDGDGELLIADNRGNGEGGFYTLDPTPKDLPPSTFPRRLSESGLFKSVKGHVTEAALIPYSVNAPLWSDGAYKERYIALPGADSQIDVTPTRGWNFPDGTVLVKSFALGPKRRWIETRFLTKQEGEWVGYSYVWNKEQTDAVLVDAKGEDREYDLGGGRTQKWHYPSRAECMSCHTRAANFVLGPTTLQMNREHTYGRVRDNQLRVLEHLGVLRVDYAGEAREQLRRQARARGLDEGQVEAYVAKQSDGSGQRPPRVSSLMAVNLPDAPRMPDPADRRADLGLRARAYLQGNCAHCHVEAGGGNAQMELEFTTPLDRARIRDVKPLHDVFGVQDARLVAPGDPDRSTLLRRISNRDRGHMPPLATSVVDEEAVALLREWIRSMPR